jgi:hypothetical protein
MSLILYDAIVRHDPSTGLSLLFTPDGAKAVTEERFERFDTACGQRIRRIPADHGELVIEGYVCEDPSEPLMSMWALAKLANEHFQVNVDVIAPD